MFYYWNEVLCEELKPNSGGGSASFQLLLYTNGVLQILNQPGFYSDVASPAGMSFFFVRNAHSHLAAVLGLKKIYNLYTEWCCLAHVSAAYDITPKLFHTLGNGKDGSRPTLVLM